MENLHTSADRRDRATPAEEMEAMALGLEGLDVLSASGEAYVRAYWKSKAERVRDILRRTRNGYRYGP